MYIALSFAVTLLIIFAVPVLVYGLFSKYAGLEEPEKKLSFFAGVLVQKIGTAVGFVSLYIIGQQDIGKNWLAYGLLWASMFAIVELGQSFGQKYSRTEAVAGIISEFIYFPLAALAIVKLLN